MKINNNRNELLDLQYIVDLFTANRCNPRPITVKTSVDYQNVFIIEDILVISERERDGPKK